VAFLLPGCSAGPDPQTSAPPPSSTASPKDDAGFSRIVSGSDDSTGALPGSPEAMYRYRFTQSDPPSDKFTYRDRDVTFYMRPTPSALYFQVENLQGLPVWIEWERSVFYPASGLPGKLAHSTTQWKDRYAVQPPTQIPGTQRFSDYTLPLDYLFDPGSSTEQLHRRLLPEDSSAPQYTNATFGMDLVMRIEDKYRTYRFRFRVVSVIPR